VRRFRLVVVPLITVAVAAACNSFPEQPLRGAMVIPPGNTTDFNELYGVNCAGCHGADGKGDAARGLADPVFSAHRR